MIIPQRLLEDIIQLELVIKERVRELNVGIYSSIYKGGGFDLEGRLEYEPGVDDVRMIDWWVTARDPEKVYVKYFRAEKRLTVWIIADLTNSMKFGFQELTKRELLIKIAAIIGFSAAHEQNRVGLIIFSDKVEKVLAPKSGRRHVYGLLEEIWGFESSCKKTDLAGSLEEGKAHLKQSNMVFLLSDFLDSQCFQKNSDFWKQVEEVAFRRDLIPVVLDEDLSFLLDGKKGNVALRDLESGKRIIFKLSKKNRDKFLKSMEERYWILKSSFMEFGSRPIFVVRKENLDKLFKFFLIRKKEKR